MMIRSLSTVMVMAMVISSTAAWCQVAQQPAAAPTIADVVTDRIALQLGRLTIENQTLLVSLDAARGRIAELEKMLKATQPDEPPPNEGANN